MSKNKNIKNRLAEHGYKIHFWYDDGKLDAIVVSRWEGEDLVFQREFKPNEIAEIVFDKYLKE